MSSSNGVEDSPTETNAPVASMDVKLMVATGSGDVQQLKHLVNKQEHDSNMMLVVMAKQAASAEKPRPQQGNMDPHLLALASSGSSEELQALLNGEDGQACGHGTDGSLTTRRASTYGGDTEANESILEGKGISAEGDTALHVVAVLRYRSQDLTEFLKWNETHLCPQNKDLTTQRDENGSTPLHFAAAMKFLFRPSSICRQVLEANPDALYQPDTAGFFPIHVAASVGAFWNVRMFVTKFLGSAGLRDAKGRTFLHVAVKKKKANLTRSSCRNLSLSWIMNMVDNEGNTVLHLAVKSSEPQIHLALIISGAVKGVRRQDESLEDNKAVRRVTCDGESKEMEVLLKDSTGILCVGSVLIAAVTFGVTFAVPGGYIADDHSNGGSPVLARRFAFKGFMVSNTLAFVFSIVATAALMFSGSPMFDPRSRSMHLHAAYYFLSISITCLAAAFALGA